ncbi:mitochondrial inner membrane protein OXA1L isoform X1 [Palaemon carinicauda]|uniref:mitochondrial inner membrane protein OXA1L isoform X1 n=1 Tax=Palaemon carinicauda TaxID=392227 RepID=UPI0035B57132
MARLFTLSKSTPMLQLYMLNCNQVTRKCLSSLSSKSSQYVVISSLQFSRYHTKTRLNSKILLKHDISHVTSRPIQRNSSYFSNILHKAFIVNAAEPFPNDSATELHPNDSIAEASPVISTEGSVIYEDVSVSSVETVITALEDKSVVDSSNITNASEAIIESISYIPPPPAPPEAVSEALNALGEPTLQSLGLGGWSPVGLIQSSLDFLHVSMGLPWWGSIALATVCIRLALFPLVIKSQKNAAKMNNNLPQLQILQMKMTEARNSGNQMEAARMAQEMMLFMKEKDISPLKNFLVPLAQAPIFISMFMGLRGMANLPMESMKEGGLLWFVDLTISDPYYLLPLITATTMIATIELGTDGARMNTPSMQNAKWLLRALPILVFPFTINFPTAVLCYWVSTNLFSLVQVGILRIPAIRDSLNIPRLVVHKPETLPQKPKGMVEGFKESWSNMKVTRELEERERYDEMRFKKAGAGPVVRTFKHNPTKKRVINIQAKVKSHN